MKQVQPPLICGHMHAQGDTKHNSRKASQGSIHQFKQASTLQGKQIHLVGGNPCILREKDVPNVILLSLLALLDDTFQLGGLCAHDHKTNNVKSMLAKLANC